MAWLTGLCPFGVVSCDSRCPDTYMNYEESLKDYRDMYSVMKNPSCAALSYLQCLALEKPWR